MSNGFAVPTDFSNTGNANYEPIPADNHVGVCVGVMDLGTHMESYQGGPEKPQRKIKIQFELPGVVRDDGKAAIISNTYNCSMNEKATLRKMLDNWLGADWPDKHKGKPWSFLIGQPAMVLTQQGPSKRDPNRISAWIGSVSKFPKGMPTPQPTRDTFYLDLSNKELPSVLSYWDALKIRESKEYRAGGFRDDAPREQPSGQGGNKTNNGHTSPASAAGPAGMPGRETIGTHRQGFDEATGEEANEVSGPLCPEHVKPLLAKYGLPWRFNDDQMKAKHDDISPKDWVILEPLAIPF